MKGTIVTGSLIVFSDGFVWKRLSNEKAYKIWVSAENDDYTGLTDEECEEIHKIQDMERLNFETLFRIVRWDYNRCFKDESLDKDLFVEKYGRVMGEHYYNKFVHEFDGNILKMVGYFRGSEKEGQVFCDMITERIEKYEQRESYNRSKLNN